MGFSLARKALAAFMLDAIEQKKHFQKILGIARNVVIMPTLLAEPGHSDCDVGLALRFLRSAIPNQDRVIP